MTIYALKIAYPWVLILLPLPILVYKFMPKASINQRQALWFPSLDRVAAAINLKEQSFKSNLKFNGIVVVIIWLLFILAASGLKWLGDPMPIAPNGRDILLAVDLSGSMQTADMTLNHRALSRLDIVKSVATSFIEKRQGDRLGLILFGTRAYLQTPLTFDRKTVTQMLNDASIGLAGIQTAIGDAIGLAVKRLIKYPKDSRALILMTDGENNAGQSDPLQAAKFAAQAGIKIYTIGLGSDRQSMSSLFSGVPNVGSDLDVTTLTQIAKITGGKFYRADGGDTLKKIYADITKLEPTKQKNRMLRPEKDLYPYPLGLILGLILLLQIRFIIKNFHRKGD